MKYISVLIAGLIIGTMTSQANKPTPSIEYSIYGIVNDPGEKSSPSETTLLRAIAGARGYTFGGKYALIIRRGTVLEVRVKDIEKDPSKDIVIKNGDIIVIPYTYYPSNQKLQPTVKTPVESGNEQGTAAEL